MKKRILNVFFELVKNSKKSDRDIAKKLKISQPTVTRIRKKLENLGYVREYTVIPNFPKLGFEIIAFVFFHTERTGGSKKLKLDAHTWIKKHPNVIFAADGDGIRGKNCMMATIHKNFTDYNKFVNEFKQMWGDNVKHLEAFLVPLASTTPKYISFKSMENLVEPD
jgi:Lrp/AsnC family leucine-responsive transcriptional regulator